MRNMRTVIAMIILLLLVGCVIDERGNMNFKFISSGQSVADAAIVAQVLHGTSLKPLSPVNLRGTRDAAGNLLIEWTRRTRLGAGMRPNTGVPLAEEDEIYQIDIMNGGTVVRTIEEKSGSSHVAMLNGLTNGQYISGNNLLSPGADIARANVVQSLGNEGFVEATLSFTGDNTNFAIVGMATPEHLQYLVNQGLGSVAPGFISQSTFTAHATFGYPEFRVEDLGLAPDYQSGNLGAVTTARIRIALSGAQIRFYWDYTGAGSVPFYVSRYASVYPMFAILKASGVAQVRDVIVGVTLHRSTVYTAADQVADWGSTQSSLTVRVAEVSAVVGRGPYVQGVL